MLRDRIVCGVSDIRTQRRLLSEKDLKFQQAFDIAQGMETAVKQAQDLQGQPKSAQVHKLQQKSSFSKTKLKGFAQLKGKCFRCGSTQHQADKCSHKEAVCNKCGTKGHLQSVCLKSQQQGKSRSDQQRKPGKGVTHKAHEMQHIDEGDNAVTYDLFSLNGSRDDRYLAQVRVEGQMLTMEVDTGSAVTIMNEHEFRKNWPEGTLDMDASPDYLKTYTEEPVKVLGKCQVRVESEGTEAVLPLFIVPGRGSSLLGRNWLRKIRLDWGAIFKISRSAPGVSIATKYSEVFQDGLGEIQGHEAQIFLKEGATPKFFKARPVPYSVKEKVEEELRRLQAEGIISPVDFADWAAPIVPVVKANGSIRVCGDYKITINQEAQVDRYPLPVIDDLFAQVGGGKVFTTLDLSHAYQQVVLKEDSRAYTTINTPMGLFQYNRLPFGISSAPGIFQRTMDTLLQGLPGVVAYLDDVLVSGKDQDEHDRNLEGVLQKFQAAGVRLRKEKCVFGAAEVTYLGYKIDAQGLHPVESKVQAIMDAPSPSNLTELKAYLGLLNYYGRFMPALSTVLSPLHELLRKNVRWKWTDSQQKAFQESKQLLLTSQVLEHYDPAKPLILSCDASPYGVGVVLSHLMDDGQERPIAFASRSLSTAEKRYAQLDKEGLAIVYGVKKFHKYLYGRHFTILTDHKPLLGILGESKGIPQMLSPRVQRWALTLAAYNYELKYKKGQTHQNADALSRLPVGTAPVDTPVPGDIIAMLEYMDSSPVTTQQIVTMTRQDPVLSKVYQLLQDGWSGECTDDALLPYYRRRTELSSQDGVVMWGSRVVVPPPGRAAILKQIHEGHPGISRSKQIARSYVWWPSMDKELENTVKSCNRCQEHRKSPPVAPLNPWPWPEKPWSRIHVDFAGPFMGKMILVVVDSHSKWIEAIPMDTSTSEATISKLRIIFATHGLPEVLVTDNGRNFTSAEFAEFCKKNCVKHVRTAPYHPASNGLAERAVQVVKEGIKKMKSGDLTVKCARFLFHYRNTPHATTGQRPSELMFHRQVRTHLDAVKPDLGAKVRAEQCKQKERHDTRAKDSHFEVDDRVFLRDVVQGIWLPGVISARTGPVSYTVELEDGRIMKRHQDHLRIRTSQPMTSPDDLILPSSDVPTTSPLASTAPASFNEEATDEIPRGIAPAAVSPQPELRRSQRQRKPPDRLNL